MKKKKAKAEKKTTKPTIPPSKKLLRELRSMINEARHAVAATVNAGLTMLYWKIGQRIQQEILKEKRAEYGERIVSTLSRQLTSEYGRGFSEKSLRHMVRFAEVFPDIAIVSALMRQLGWSHFKEVIYLNDSLKRDFYAEMCRVERWSVRTLRKKLDSMLYERTALSRKPKKLARAELAKLKEEDKVSPDLVLKDPYILDFLGLRDRYMESRVSSFRRKPESRMTGGINARMLYRVSA